MEKEKLNELFNLWDLGKPISFKKVKKGVVNTNWIVKTTEGKYILRQLGKNKNLKELNFELKYLDYLKNKGFSYKIPAPIKNKKGDFFMKKNESIFWIYEFIDGGVINRFGKKELIECAQAMSEYHRIIEKSNLNNQTNYSEFARNEILEELIEFRKEIGNLPKDDKEKIFLGEINKLIPLLNNLNVKRYSGIKKYPLHRDIISENTLWKNKKLVGIIDFENVSEINETFIKDIVVMLQYSCLDKKKRYQLNLSLMKFFLKEYQKYNPLSDEEIKSIPDIIIAGAIEDFSYSYGMFFNDIKRAKLSRLKYYSKMALWADKNREKILNEIK